MRIRSFPVFLLFLGVCLTACDGRKAGRNGQADLHVRVPVETDIAVSDFVSHIDYIKLDDRLSENRFASIDKLIIADGKIYTFEFRGNNRIHVFDEEGNFLHTIGKKGRGPGEYIILRNFTVVDDAVLLLNRQNMEIIYYDTNGNYLETKKMPFRADDLVALEDGNFLFAMTKGLLDNKKVVLTDNEFNILDTKLVYSDRELDDLMWISYFKQTGEKIAFAHPVNDTIYLFNLSGSIDSKVYMDFADHKVPDNMRDSYMKIWSDRKYSYMDSAPVIFEDYMTGTIVRKEQKWTFILNRHTNEISLEPVRDRSHFNVRGINFPLTEYEGNVVAYINYDLVGEECFEKNRFPKEICSFLQDGGNVLCFIKVGANNSEIDF